MLDRLGLTGLRRKTKPIVAGVTALMAVPAFGLLTAPGAGAAAGDTPDNNWETVPGGYVMWNDYNDSDHDVDYDDFILEDDAGDGLSIQLRVYWNGRVYSTHAYYGEEETLGIGNVPNGSKVYWDICQWDDGVRYWCGDADGNVNGRSWFRE